MTTLQLFFLTLFTSGVTIISYKGYAQQKGWTIGILYYSDTSILKIIGMLALVLSFTISFFYFQWYYVLAGAILGWMMSGAITALFQVSTQYIALVMFIFSFILLIFS